MAYVVGSSYENKHVTDIEVLDEPELFVRFLIDRDVVSTFQGVEVPVDLLPTRFSVKGKKSPDFGFLTTGSGYLVDDRVRDAAEALEPGVHRFHPVDIKMEDGRPLARPHFLLNCCVRLDAIDPDNSLVTMLVPPGPDDPGIGRVTVHKPFPPEPEEPWVYETLGTKRGLSVVKKKIAGHAIWWDWRCQRLFMSDTMVEAMQMAGVEGMGLSPHVEET